MDYKICLQRPSVGLEEIEFVKLVIASGNLVEGEMVKRFEETVADYIGVKYAIACTSATVGLELALRAVDVKEGDEVIVPSFTHPATALAVMTVGAEPVLVDVDIGTYNVTADVIKEAITEKTKAIIPVSIFGNPLDFDPIRELVEENELSAIEDAACSLGSEHKNRKIGSLADLSIFSFHPRKIFTTGDGGIIATNYKAYWELCNSMKKFGSAIPGLESPGFYRWGTNYRMSDILGAVALPQVRKIDEIVKIRQEKARYYDELLTGVPGVRLPKITPASKSNYQTYAVYIESGFGKRGYIIKELAKKNIEVQIGAYALHALPVFKNTRRVGNLQNSLALYNRLLALPLHGELTEADQISVARELKRLL